MLKHISARSPRNKLFSILSTFVFADSFDEENSDDSDTTFRPPMRRKKMDFDDSSNEENSDDNETSFRLPMRQKKMDFDDSAECDRRNIESPNECNDKFDSLGT